MSKLALSSGVEGGRNDTEAEEFGVGLRSGTGSGSGLGLGRRGTPTGATVSGTSAPCET